MAEVFERRGKRVTLIDLSDLLGNETAAFEPAPHRIEYMSQEEGLAQSEEWLGLGAEFWPDGQVWSADRVSLTTHSGTHIDAPSHYGPAKHGPTRTIDQVPLRWCFGDGVVLDMTHKAAGEGITSRDVQAELARIGYRLKPYDIVLVRTDVSKHFKEPGYDQMHPGLRRSATEWLVDRGVKLIGIDAWGLDRPMNRMVEEAKAGNKEAFWESHLLGREKEYCQIEKLANLDQLPTPFGFTVIAFPVNLRGTTAAWSRVVAMYEETLPPAGLLKALHPVPVTESGLGLLDEEVLDTFPLTEEELLHEQEPDERDSRQSSPLSMPEGDS
jgi:kynurenine formamidase